MKSTSPESTGRWSAASIAELLNKNSLAVERALVAIYDRQTTDEKSSDHTKHHNRIGFSAAHDRRGSYYARWILGGRHLSGQHIDKGRKIALHYCRQLADIANAKEAAKKREPADQLTDELKDVAADIKMMNEVRRINGYISGTIQRHQAMAKRARDAWRKAQ